MVIFTKKFRTLDPHLPIVWDKVLKKTVFFWTPSLKKKSYSKCYLSILSKLTYASVATYVFRRNLNYCFWLIQFKFLIHAIIHSICFNKMMIQTIFIFYRTGLDENENQRLQVWTMRFWPQGLHQLQSLCEDFQGEGWVEMILRSIQNVF